MSEARRPSERPRNDGRKQGGAALIIVVLTTLVVSALLGAMLIESNTEHLIAGNERDAERALEVSKAGLNYAFYLYDANLLNPTTSGTSFDSYATAVAASLDGGSFTGAFFDDSALVGSGQRYRIRSTGTYRNTSRTTEMSFLLTADALRFGYMGFDDVTLHHHASGASIFNITSTIFSNNAISVDSDMNIDGTVVSSGSISIASGSTVQGDAFGYSISNSGTVKGRAGLVASVAGTSSTPSVVDNEGSKYIWYSGRSNPGTKVGGTVVGGVSRYVVKNGDIFDSAIFAADGSTILNPPLNVIEYIAPPKIDYRAMKTEADLNDATYFTTPALAYDYFRTKKVTQTIGGQTLTTMKVGTTAAPEWIYVVGAVDIQLDPDLATDKAGSGTIKADGLHIEGGIYASGGFTFNGKGFRATDVPNTYPVGYHELYINALPYCFPGVLAYNQPSVKGGSIATWTVADTPAIGSGASVGMSSSGGDWEGTSYINGVVYAQSDIHLHHTQADKELITFRGAELAWKIHNCDFFNFVYDKQVGCTKFLSMQGGGTPGVLSFREIR